MEKLRILLLGDLVGKTGRLLFARHINDIRSSYKIDATIVNGENSSHGKGISPKVMAFFKEHNVDLVTSGNHIWDRREIIPYMHENNDLLRPANYPSKCPGKGIGFFECKGFTVAVINLMGRVFMKQDVDCPFRSAESLVQYAASKTPIILVDMHAETTAEKLGMGYFLEGKVSGVVGTHTHVQTNDARILPGGTAYISDLGMGGSLNSMIGIKKEAPLHTFLTQMPARHEVETEPPYVLSGVVIEIDPKTGTAEKIETIYKVDASPLGD
jgi:2',3'-cyclic-nucleotide 2'-phosphodiesterase